MPLRRICVLASVAAISITAIAQQPQVFRSETRVVQVDVIVRNDKGPVTGLTQNDFQILDNGRQGQITSFSVVVSQAAAFANVKAPKSPTPGANEKPSDRPVSA